MECPRCGENIHPKRVEILEEKNMPVQCIKCAEGNVEKVAGYMPSESKMKGSIEIVDQATAQELHSKAHRAGTGVSRGVKFHTGRK